MILYYLILIVSFCSQQSILPAAKPHARKPAPAQSPTEDPATKNKKTISTETAKIKSTESSLKSMIATLKRDTAILENKGQYKTKFQNLLKKIEAAKKKITTAGGTPPASTNTMTWEILDGQIRWVTKAQYEQAAKTKMVTAANKKLDSIAKKLRGKAVTDELAKKYETAVAKLIQTIKTNGGSPSTSWETIKGSFKTGDGGDDAQAKRINQKAISIKVALATKQYTPEKVVLLKKSYTTQRDKLLKLSPDLAKSLPAPEQLIVRTTGTADDAAVKTKQLSASIKKLNAINKILTSGVSQQEADQQKAKFDRESQVAQKLNASAPTKQSIPVMAKPTIVDDAKAIQKYRDAIASIDKQLVSKKMGVLQRSATEINALLVKRNKLEKQAQKLGATDIPPAPTPGAGLPAAAAAKDTTKVAALGDQVVETKKVKADGIKGFFGAKKTVAVTADGKEVGKVYTKEDLKRAEKKGEKEGEKDAASGQSGGMGMGGMGMGMGMGMGGMGMGMGMAPGMGMGMAGVGMAGMGMAGMAMAPAGASGAASATNAAEPNKKDFINFNDANKDLLDLVLPTIFASPFGSLITAQNYTTTPPAATPPDASLIDKWAAATK